MSGRLCQLLARPQQLLRFGWLCDSTAIGRAAASRIACPAHAQRQPGRRSMSTSSQAHPDASIQPEEAALFSQSAEVTQFTPGPPPNLSGTVEGADQM